jgi:hypothetical protein
MYLLCAIHTLLVVFVNTFLILSALFVGLAYPHSEVVFSQHLLRVGHVSLLVAPRTWIFNFVVVYIVWNVRYWCFMLCL